MRVIHVVIAAVLIAPASAALGAPITLTREQCTAARLGTSIEPRRIGAPVSTVTLDAPVWSDAVDGVAAHCLVTGSMAPVDQSATARPIRFGIALPASWNRIGLQMGGGGLNGTVPQLAGANAGAAPLGSGIATYGSDSGHTTKENEWTQNDEAIRNLGFLQMKKTHDAAMVIVQRAYGSKPAYNYYVGTSQGGREALTVAQRYPADYNGIAANVPVVNFTGLMFAPTWIRAEEKPLANWVPASKGPAIVAEFMRQCDGLDGLVDGVINNYVACRAIFNVHGQPAANHAWDGKHCPGDRDPKPDDDSVDACFTSAQIETLKFIFSTYRYAMPLASGNTTFGMWAPTTDVVADASPPGTHPGPRSPGVLADRRYRGQEGAAGDAPVYTSLGMLGLTGFVLRDLHANPLDYVDGTTAVARRRDLADWMDATNPDLSAFRKRGGKLLVAIGTNDTVASSGSQLDYYQAVLDRMGRASVDSFARFYVLPQTGHALVGWSHTLDGNGKSIPAKEIPSTFDRVALLRDWVEKGSAPAKSVIVTGRGGSRPMCSYPQYPHYAGGDVDAAASYVCTDPRRRNERVVTGRRCADQRLPGRPPSATFVYQILVRVPWQPLPRFDYRRNFGRGSASSPGKPGAQPTA